MLHREAVEPATLELLKKLMALPLLKTYNLAGGTALALQIGHRMSIDLDFFGQENIDSEQLLSEFENIGNTEVQNISEKILQATIDGVKVDIVNYKFKLLNEPIIVDQIRLLSDQDIAAMKLSAIGGRGSKKDFFDLYFLLDKFSLQEILDFAKEKFENKNLFHLIKSVSFFDDAENDLDPKMLIPIKWNEVKSRIQSSLKESSILK